MFKLVHYVTRTVGKWAVAIRLKCLLVTARKCSLQRLYFYKCLSVQRWGGIPACIAGLQSHTRGEVEGSGLGGLQAHTRRGLQAHTRGRGYPIIACTEAPPQQTTTAVGGMHPTAFLFWQLILHGRQILLMCYLPGHRKCSTCSFDICKQYVPTAVRKAARISCSFYQTNY